jgi:hypothetical protein
MDGGKYGILTAGKLKQRIAEAAQAPAIHDGGLGFAPGGPHPSLVIRAQRFVIRVEIHEYFIKGKKDP